MAVGQVLPEISRFLDGNSVDAYRSAVLDESGLYQAEPNVIPPTAIAATALREFLEVLSLPPGTIHAGQELSFLMPLKTSIQITYRGTITQNNVRGDWRFLSLEFSASHQDRDALRGKTTLIVPIR